MLLWVETHMLLEHAYVVSVATRSPDNSHVLSEEHEDHEPVSSLGQSLFVVHSTQRPSAHDKPALQPQSSQQFVMDSPWSQRPSPQVIGAVQPDVSYSQFVWH